MEQREILYRARTTEGEWVYGQYIKSKDLHLMFVDEGYELTQMGFGQQFEEIIPSTLGQYTGLKDLNGTRIFEGDKCYHKTHEINTRCEFTENYSCFTWIDLDGGGHYYYQQLDSKNLEITGHIYFSEGGKVND